ncbi:Alpha/Beta hydrolase protein [Fusarium oxysporum f. sp. albedinis]|nr:Alpha/Beta hydrolase protein [Fusarium oxysporum f. sp. albedinis]KAK2471619.1 hypothetical protein H9L39_16610 [Fusarium oxysporum f. sp. albedinis]
MFEDLAALTSIRHLVAYASLAYHNHDGAEFRAYAEGFGLHGNLTARKISSNRTGLHAHLGIQNDNSLVIVFSGYSIPRKYEDYVQPTLWDGLFRSLVMTLGYGFTEPGWAGSTNIFVHKGFLLAFNDLAANLSLSINGLLNGKQPQKIEVCGHGIGGAIATLCALWCRIRWTAANITCVTLGSPMVGDERFAREFNSWKIYCYRLIIRSDPVANLPNSGVEKILVRYSDSSLFGITLREGGAAHTWKHVGIAIPLGPETPEKGPRRFTSEVGRATIYAGEHWWLWVSYWLLRVLQILLTISVYPPMDYATYFHKMLEERKEESMGKPRLA